MVLLSGIFRRFSSILGNKRKSENAEHTEEILDQGQPPNKVIKLTEGQRAVLKTELENIQTSLATQIYNFGNKLKSIEDQGNSREEENRNLKDLLYEGSLEVKAEKRKNEELMGLLKETQEKMEESLRQTARLLEVTKAKLGMETTRNVTNSDVVGGSSVAPSFPAFPSQGMTLEHILASRTLSIPSTEEFLCPIVTILPKTTTGTTDTPTPSTSSESLASDPTANTVTEKSKSNSNPSSSISDQTVPPQPSGSKEKPTTSANNVEEPPSKAPRATSDSNTTPSNAAVKPTTSDSKNATSESKTTSDSTVKPTTSDSKKASSDSKTTETTATASPEPVDEKLRLSSLIGLDVEVKFLRESVLFPLANKEALSGYGVQLMKGVVFHGKSAAHLLVAKSLTAELSQFTGETFSLFRRKKTDVFERYSDDAVPFMKNIFDSALAKAPAVVLIEDIETLTPCSDTLAYAGYTTLIAEIEKFLDLIEAGRIFVIMTTTELSKVPQAFVQVGRLEKALGFANPNDAFRLGILRDQTKGWKKIPSQSALEEISKKTKDLSIDKLEQLCREASLRAFQRHFSSVCMSESLKLNSEVGDAIEITSEDWTSALNFFHSPKVEQKKTPTTTSEAVENIVGEPIDSNLSFESVAGLDAQMKEIRENILFPLSNKSALGDWGVEPVKGIIFYGPPGTGKTLLAKSLAAELSRLTDTPFTFFYKKGTDSIQKYIGWTEAYLKKLFDTAKASKPSIIFFDEIDGLCAKRSDGGSSTFYNGLVTNMLGHMDSIKRGEVLVIAATNRLDALDPAMTRPGRFDKSIAFFHPKEEGRKAILEIHTSKWKRGREGTNLDEMAKQTEGYTGADLEQLCRQAFVSAIRRQFPKLGADKVNITDFETFDVLLEDWYSALKTVKPDNTTSPNSNGKALTPAVSKLISGIQNEIIDKLSPSLTCLELGFGKEKGSGIKSFLIWESAEPSQTRSVLDAFILPSLIGSPEFKDTQTFSLVDGKIEGSTLKALLGQVLSCPKTGILYIPQIDKIHDKFAYGDTITPKLFVEQLESLRGENVLLLATASCPDPDLPEEFRSFFKGVSGNRSYKLRPLQKSEVREFFVPILEEKFPVLLDRVESLAENSSIYDILDLKAEIITVSGSTKDSKEEDVTSAINAVLNNFSENQLARRGQRNNMYS